MWKNLIINGLVICAFVLSPKSSPAQNAPVSGTYLITSGSYIECCGFIGNPLEYSLPNLDQMFIRLAVDSTNNRATMSFLRPDLQTVFSAMSCPAAPPVIFTFSNGIVESNRIVFEGEPGPDPTTLWNYTVSNAANAIQVHGTVRTLTFLCADVPTMFTHTNVVAGLLPNATIRASEVEVCWNSILNRNHQVQYRSALATNTWINLGAPIPGNGLTNCVTDKIPPGEPRRFYRVVIGP